MKTFEKQNKFPFTSIVFFTCYNHTTRYLCLLLLFCCFALTSSIRYQKRLPEYTFFLQSENLSFCVRLHWFAWIGLWSLSVRSWLYFGVHLYRLQTEVCDSYLWELDGSFCGLIGQSFFWISLAMGLLSEFFISIYLRNLFNLNMCSAQMWKNEGINNHFGFHKI